LNLAVNAPAQARVVTLDLPADHATAYRIEVAERALRDIGVTGDLRVRYYGETARVEMAPGELARWRTGEGRCAVREAVMSAGFERVEIDLRGFRSGSLNRAGDQPLVESLGAS